MLLTSIFTFSHNVFYPSQKEFLLLSMYILLSANAFNLDHSKSLSFSKELRIQYQVTASKYNASGPLLPEDGSFIFLKINIIYRGLWKVENIVQKGENASFQHFFPPPTKVLFPSILNPLPDDTFWTFPNWKSLQMAISNLTKMAESYPNG